MVSDNESSIDSSSTLRGSMCVLHHSHPHDGERGSCSHPHDGETGELSDLAVEREMPRMAGVGVGMHAARPLVRELGQ